MDKRTQNAGWTIGAGAALALALSWAGASAQPMPAQPRAAQGSTPAVGQKAGDFTLGSLDGGAVRLADEVARGPVVVTVLRGWPGYDCPFCTRQFADYLANAKRFEQSGARVLFIYPGPADGLQPHAQAFIASRPMPPAFRVLLDPNYTFTNAYGLRWNAKDETAYPATLVIDKHGVVTFAQTSRGHGDRVAAEVVLKALAAMPS